MATIYAPIWKDCVVDLGQHDDIYFRISKKKGLAWEVIYTGRAYKRPTDSNIIVRINDIVADYIIPTFTNNFDESHFPGGTETFKVSTASSPSGTWADIANTYIFYNDWSYIERSSSNGLADPINGHVSPIQPLPFSVNRAGSIVVNAVMEDGEEETDTTIMPENGGTAIFSLADAIGKVKTISIRGKEYKAVDCCKYVIYYLNAFGGWDSFLIEGNTTRVDSLTRHTRSARYDNDADTPRGKVNYATEMGVEYTMHTGWLSDDEASRMHHLLNTTQAFLYDLDTSVMLPIVLTNSTTEYKSFKTSGEMVSYEITAEVADYRVRR